MHTAKVTATPLSAPAEAARARNPRRFPLFMLTLAAGSYFIDTVLLSLFAVLGTVPATLPVGYGLAALAICSSMTALIIYRSHRRHADPHFQMLQVGVGTSIQLVGLYLFPDLGFFFLNALFIVFTFNALQLSLRQLATHWLVVALAAGMAVYAATGGIAIPHATPEERTLVLACYLLTLARCAYLGYFGSRLRDRVHKANLRFRTLNEQLEQRVAARTRELQQANDELTEAARQLQSFAYSVAHDFRQPLIALNGYTGMLQRKLAGSGMEDAAREYLQRVQGATARMEGLTDGLIDLAKVNRADLTRRPVDLSAIAHRILDARQRAEPDRQVDIEIAPGVLADADGALVRMALEALLSNAWKFTSGMPQARIRFHARQIDGRQELVVEDNGAGFDQAYANKLFGIFQRLHADREYPGSGIGLAIVERVVRRHGGAIRAEGMVGRGATFRFTLSA